MLDVGCCPEPTLAEANGQQSQCGGLLLWRGQQVGTPCSCAHSQVTRSQGGPAGVAVGLPP